jgi:dipeptidyl aminopeptidase/acylaminoacyl peptidase
LTWDDPPDGRTGPVLLWLRATDRPEPPAEFSSSLPVWASAGTTQLELRLHWPPDATVELLHDQIVDPVRTAISLLSEPSGRPVVVGGHSFGATLALYALAHLPEPVAAIAHSGCYNRTLVPTGFQNEQRQYWDAPELYQAFSAQHFADRLDRPVLLVHGSEDLNPATPPEQAVGLYRAIVARGGHARLVLFAGEGHNFHFRETLTTLAAEHRDWLSRCDPGRRATP